LQIAVVYICFILLFFIPYDWNMHQAERDGYGIHLEIVGLKAETLVDAVNKAVNNPV